MLQLTPREIVQELDRFIVGQHEAKRAVAIALRNRQRRALLPAEQRRNITPRNILLMGPTGVGKTEIARRLAQLVEAPFIKVDATKFTEVGYVGRDVDSIIRDLVEVAVDMLHEHERTQVQANASIRAEERLLDYLAKSAKSKAKAQAKQAVAAQSTEGEPTTRRQSRAALRRQLAHDLAEHKLDDQMVEIEIEPADLWGMGSYASEVEMEEEGGEAGPGVIRLWSPPKPRVRTVSVREAREILTEEEVSKLVDWDRVVAESIALVEEEGIVFIDELDKLITNERDGGPDVSGEGVQRDLLPIVDGTTVHTRYGPVNTEHILFIAAGAFHTVKPSDLIPELQGRFPLRVEMHPLTKQDLERILIEPENSLLKQYTALLATEGVTLTFTPDAVSALADIAWQMNMKIENIGARRLSTVTEKVLSDLSFTAPDHAGETIRIDAAFVYAQLQEYLQNEDLSRYIL